MTVAAVLALVILVAALAAHALHRYRHKESPAMPLSRIAPGYDPDAPAPGLPVGYDDPESLAYVPDALRSWWDPTPLDRLAVRNAVALHGRQARVDVARHNDPAAFAAAMRADRIDPASVALSRVEDALYGHAAGSVPPLTAEDEARAEHLARLASAAAAARAASEEETSAAMRAAYRCRACGTQKPTVADPLCPACADVATALRLRSLAGDVLPDGRTREESVRAYLDRG